MTLDGCSEGFRNDNVVPPPILNSSGMFHCPQCNQGFKQRSNAQSHFKSVHLNLKSKCLECGKYFKKLKSHIQDVHSEKKMTTCKICGKDYPEGRLFKDHINKTHFQDTDGNPHEKYLETKECDVCGKFVLKSRFERHMRMKHYLPSNFVVECPICRAHVKYLPWHLHKFHKSMDYSRTMKKCEQCDQWFLKSEDLEKHLIDHEKYFCFDCLLNFDSHLKLAKHMYTVHKKVFNIGETFKINKTKTLQPAVTYHIDKTSGPQSQVDVGSHNTTVERMAPDQRIIDSELLDTLEEESFTVVLDEKGNLQNVILGNKEEVCVQGIGGEDENRNHRSKEAVSEMVSHITDYNLNISGETAELEETVDLNKLDYTFSNKVLVLEENMMHESDQECDVEVDENTNTFQIIIPSERTNKYENFLSENLIKIIQDSLPSVCEDVQETKESKLHERFVASKNHLPKSLNGVELSPEDEDVLNKAPNLEDFKSKDLVKYQIGKSEEADSNSNKYQACPSRQAHLCPYCRKVLKSRHSLNMHISVVHLAAKKFSCDDCEKQFATKADLMKHQKATHDVAGKELVKCSICNESFKSSYLKRHKYYKHPPNNLPKHCSECGKEFKSREIMLKHIKKIHMK